MKWRYDKNKAINTSTHFNNNTASTTYNSYTASTI